MRSAERLVAAQSAQIGVTEADLYPTLFINGTIGWDAQDFSKVFATKSFLGLVTPGFRCNVLNYGRILNNIHLQEARVHELVAAYQSKVLSAGREVQVSLRGFLKSREQAEALGRSVTAASAANEIGVSQYRAGTIDFNRVFNLETIRLQQQDQLASAQGEIALSLISVYRALGGGWQLRLLEELPVAPPAVALESNLDLPPIHPGEQPKPNDRTLADPNASPRPDTLSAALPER